MQIGTGIIYTAGDFSAIVDPYLWKRLKNDDDDIVLIEFLKTVVPRILKDCT